MIEKIKKYLRENADNKQSVFWLRVIAFTESSFFPIPPDPFQIVLTFAKPDKWKKFAKNIVIFSVLGGLFGYALGYYFFDFFGAKFVTLYNLEGEVEKMRIFFENTTFWAMFISALTPIPYKLFTITAGLFSANLISFVVASLLGRGIRFYGVGWVARFIGEKYAEKIFHRFDLVAGFLGLLILAYFVYKYLI